MTTANKSKEIEIASGITNFFPEYIGNKMAIEYFCRVIQMRASGKILPYQACVLTGMQGAGKSHLAGMIAKKLSEFSEDGTPYAFIELAPDITLPTLMQVWAREIEGKPAVIFLEEAHDLVNKKVKNFLKMVMETNSNVKQVPLGNSYATANPFQHFYIAASNMNVTDQALFGEKGGRFKTIHIEPFSSDESKMVIRQKAAEFDLQIMADAVEFLSTRCVPNPRAIRDMVKDECALHAQDGKVTKEIAKEIAATYKRYPLGLSKSDIMILSFLSTDSNGRQVNEIASSVKSDPKCVSVLLSILAGMGLVWTANSRKKLTELGKEYLAKLAEAQKRAKAAMGEKEGDGKPKKTTKKEAAQVVEAAV